MGSGRRLWRERPAPECPGRGWPCPVLGRGCRIWTLQPLPSPLPAETRGAWQRRVRTPSRQASEGSAAGETRGCQGTWVRVRTRRVKVPESAQELGPCLGTVAGLQKGPVPSRQPPRSPESVPRWQSGCAEHECARVPRWLQILGCREPGRGSRVISDKDTRPLCCWLIQDVGLVGPEVPRPEGRGPGDMLGRSSDPLGLSRVALPPAICSLVTSRRLPWPSGRPAPPGFLASAGRASWTGSRALEREQQGDALGAGTGPEKAAPGWVLLAPCTRLPDAEIWGCCSHPRVPSSFWLLLAVPQDSCRPRRAPELSNTQQFPGNCTSYQAHLRSGGHQLGRPAAPTSFSESPWAGWEGVRGPRLGESL